MNELPLGPDVQRTSRPVPWPGGARCAVTITFDFDAETMWLSRDTSNARRPASQGPDQKSRTSIPSFASVGVRISRA